jgi:hypothetical protein
MIWFLSGIGDVQTPLSGMGCVPTPNVHSDVWDHVESYAIHVRLACRLKITFTSSLKLIISFFGTTTTPSFLSLDSHFFSGQSRHASSSSIMLYPWFGAERPTPTAELFFRKYDKCLSANASLLKPQRRPAPVPSSNWI